MTSEIDHSRGLCQIPDVPSDTPREEVEKNSAHCRCCNSKMDIKEMSDSFAMLGMYELLCPVCPGIDIATENKIFKVRERFYAVRQYIPQYDFKTGSYLDIQDSEEVFVSAQGPTEAIDKAYNHIINCPTKFSYQGCIEHSVEQKREYFKKNLHKVPPDQEKADYIWLEVVREIEVIK